LQSRRRRVKEERSPERLSLRKERREDLLREGEKGKKRKLSTLPLTHMIEVGAKSIGRIGESQKKRT